MLPTPPFSLHQSGGVVEFETTDQTEGRRGNPRNVKGPEGAPKFGFAALESAIFWWISTKLCNISVSKAPFFPNAQAGMGGRETTAQTKGPAERHGTSRNATELGGSPNFGHSALESAKFWWIFSKLSNILCFQRPPFPQHPSGEGAECETTDETKGAAKHSGTLRNLTERLNLASPRRNPPYFGAFLQIV